MMMVPPPHPHFHYSPFHHHHGPPVSGPGPDFSDIMMHDGPRPHNEMMPRPPADAERRHAEAVHRWRYERAAGTGTGKPANGKSAEKQDMPSEGDTDKHESGCKSSSSQDDMYENALLLASLAKSPGTDNSRLRLDRRALDQNDDLPQAEPPQDQVDAAIPKPNIVTPVSSERQFVEELHQHHRVLLSPPDESFYQRQERGGDKSSTSQPAIFRTPQKKRGHGEDARRNTSSSKSKKKMRAVYGQHPAYPPSNGLFVSPGPPLPFSKEGAGAEYPPPPYSYPYPHNLPPRFDSGHSRRQVEEEEVSPYHRSSPSYPPTAFPFPLPRFTPSRHPSQLPPHPHTPQFIYRHNDHYLAAGTIEPRHNNDDSQTLASHGIGFRRSTKQKEYPAIASIDPNKAYLAGKTVITRSKWAWRDFPELEAFLVENRETYLQHSAMNYTQEQKEYNNKLTERLLEVADENGYIFHANDFDFVSIRDRIRCYYKSYVQAKKKKGKIVSYPKVKRTVKADKEGIEEE